MYDLIIRNGIIYDGKGGSPFEADIAIEGTKIKKLGKIKEKGKEEIQAQDHIVTPGFIDIHTHYDGQVTWDPLLTPSNFHGITTAIMGNCGVGFAPCLPEKRDWLIGLMEGVEDIPGTALVEGIKWNWESFLEYMNAVESMPRAIDVGLQIPHGAVRAYVMGERAENLELATDYDIKLMGNIVEEALKNGAMGFTTSRTFKHRDREGKHTPTFEADAAELHGIAQSISKANKGVIQLISDFYEFDYEFNLIKGMAEISGRPLSLTIEQDDRYPDIWINVLKSIEREAKKGLIIKGQVPPRPTGVLQGLTATLNPFLLHKTFFEIANFSLKDQVQKLQDPLFRKRLIEEEPEYFQDSDSSKLITFLLTSYDKMFDIGDPPNYEPDPSQSIASIAKAEGKHPKEVILDKMLQKDGNALIYFPLFNYSKGNLDDVRFMLTHENTAFGLGDAGAHCGVLCDASFPTTLLTHWTRDRTRGEKLPLEWVIMKQTKMNAEWIGLEDRGILDVGMKADINIIDYDNLTLSPPEITYDLPGFNKRLIQKTSGYKYTIVSGQVAFCDGKSTGKMPGKLVRS